jgi:pimeloyl-[acyl-carrier protein] synthase
MSAITTESYLAGNKDSALSLYHLLEADVLANPYPLYRRLREEDPVHWDPFLHAWVVTRYADVMTVLHNFSAQCAPSPEKLNSMGLADMSPIAQVMMRQMLFMDPPAHTRLRALSSQVFAPKRVEVLRNHIQDIVNGLIVSVAESGHMEVMADFANQLPTIITAELMGVPHGDIHQLKAWTAEFAEILGNFQHNPDRASDMLRNVEEMSAYFREEIQSVRKHPREGVINALLTAEINGDRLSEDSVIANCILVMVGGQETTPNLIGNGMLSLLRNPDQMEMLRSDLSLVISAVEELLRYESPSQHTTRLAPEDTELGGKKILKGQSVIAVMGAANRDPERFPNPDKLDITRKDNKHVAFGAGAHFCFGAPLARIEGQVAFETLLRRFGNIALTSEPLAWRENLGLRGLLALPIAFESLPN